MQQAAGTGADPARPQRASMLTGDARSPAPATHRRLPPCSSPSPAAAPRSGRRCRFHTLRLPLPAAAAPGSSLRRRRRQLCPAAAAAAATAAAPRRRPPGRCSWRAMAAPRGSWRRPRLPGVVGGGWGRRRAAPPRPLRPEEAWLLLLGAVHTMLGCWEGLGGCFWPLQRLASATCTCCHLLCPAGEVGVADVAPAELHRPFRHTPWRPPRLPLLPAARPWPAAPAAAARPPRRWPGPPPSASRPSRASARPRDSRPRCGGGRGGRSGEAPSSAGAGKHAMRHPPCPCCRACSACAAWRPARPPAAASRRSCVWQVRAGGRAGASPAHKRSMAPAGGAGWALTWCPLVQEPPPPPPPAAAAKPPPALRPHSLVPPAQASARCP